MTRTPLPTPDHDTSDTGQVPLPVLPDPHGSIPSTAQCTLWWDAYAMLDNIRAHSLQVTRVALAITAMVLKTSPHLPGADDPARMTGTIRAAALLHDLAKTYCIRYGGNHAQLGASWVVNLTDNPAIGQGVLHHIFWPGPVDTTLFFIPLVIAYSDKRVRHDEVVSLDSRLKDILHRYGKTPRHQEMITRSFDQVRQMEHQLEHQTGVDLNAYPFDSRGLVE